jgi:hypothetical protein
LFCVVEIEEEFFEGHEDGEISFAFVGLFKVVFVVVFELLIFVGFAVGNGHDVQAEVVDHVELLQQAVHVADAAGVYQAAVFLFRFYFAGDGPVGGCPPQGDVVGGQERLYDEGEDVLRVVAHQYFL